MTNDMILQLAEWRQKARNNELSPEELRQAIIALREDRVRADATSKTSKGKSAAAKVKPDSDKLLDELEGL